MDPDSTDSRSGSIKALSYSVMEPGLHKCIYIYIYIYIYINGLHNSSKINVYMCIYIYIYFFYSIFPTRIPFRVFTGRSHCVGAFDPNTPPDNPALFLHSPRIRACTRLPWCGKTSCREGKPTSGTAGRRVKLEYVFTENKLKLSFPACRLNTINVLSVSTAERLLSKC